MQSTPKKNIFLTGPPSSGKTTIIRKVIDSLRFPANGFYTQEEREGGKRIGFLMTALDGRKGYLAHQAQESGFRIRRYGVSIKNIEAIAVPSLIPVGRNVIILDEIGKMECFSEAFRRAAMAALDSPNVVIGTITCGGDDFILGIKKREDLVIHEVTPENRDMLPDSIINEATALLKQFSV